jgi:hypothetical protein
MNTNVFVRNLLGLGLLIFLVSVVSAENAAKVTPAPNTKMTYILAGEMVSGWAMQLSDPGGSSSSVIDRRGKSVSGKVSVSPTDYKARNDALKLVWSRANELGNVELSGTEVDLSSVENTAALVLDLKVEMAPNKDVLVGMNCGPSCRGTVNINKVLVELKKSDWTAVPIALNCFTQAGLNIKKVSGPLTISTDGKLALLITNARLQKLEAGDKSCAASDSTPKLTNP